MAQAVYATIPEPSEADEWNMLGQKIFPDWHGPGLAQYHSAGWTLQALVDYRCAEADCRVHVRLLHQQSLVCFWSAVCLRCGAYANARIAF